MILTAPDLQLDCLEDDDEVDEDDDDDDEEEEDSIGNCTETFLDSTSNDDTANTITTTSSSGSTNSSSVDVGPPAHPSTGLPVHRIRSASASDSVAHPKIRRLNNHRDPFRHNNDVLSNSINQLYIPHSQLLRRQQLQRELQRRFRTYNRDEDETNWLLSNSLGHRHRISANTSGMLIESQLNRFLQLVGVRGINNGLRQEVIEKHSSKAKYAAVSLGGGGDDKDEDGEKCTICLDNFEMAIEIRILNCKHYFHTDCVDRWLKCNKQCPMCRLHVDALAAVTEVQVPSISTEEETTNSIENSTPPPEHPSEISNEPSTSAPTSNPS